MKTHSINFRTASIETTFVNAPLSGAECRRFSIDHENWRGPRSLVELISSLLSDWGTGLELALYQQATIHLLGGDAEVSVMLPMTTQGRELGKQRFHLATPDSAFCLTAFANPPIGYAFQLTRLLH
ncbi:MAG: hypothetical protein ACI8W8_001670 [Rhodothermales bacterium]|jgi:hypothetical protein